MYHTNLKRKVEQMEVGEVFRPAKGYREPTLRNYASRIGKALGRSYSVRRENNYNFIIRRNS